MTARSTSEEVTPGKPGLWSRLAGYKCPKCGAVLPARQINRTRAVRDDIWYLRCGGCGAALFAPSVRKWKLFALGLSITVLFFCLFGLGLGSFGPIPDLQEDPLGFLLRAGAMTTLYLMSIGLFFAAQARLTKVREFPFATDPEDKHQNRPQC